jgi:hypothetical protein
MNDEPAKWQRDMAMLFCGAMQTAIEAWKDPRIEAMSKEDRASVMAEITKEFVLQSFDIVDRLLGTTSSS